MLREAFVIATTTMGLESQVLNEIKGIPEVKEVHIIQGVFDLILKVQANTLEELKDIVSHIRRNHGVKSLLSLIVDET